MAAYFSFAGVSSTTMGLSVVSMTIPPRAERTVEELDIPGRTTPLVAYTGSTKFVDISITAEVSAGADIRAIYSWLSGNGDLILSDEPEKKYAAYACKPVSCTRTNGVYRTITYTFRCAPFARAVSNDYVDLAASPELLQTTGTTWSEPTVQLTASGDVTVTINGAELSVPNVAGTIHIDVQAKKVYSLDGGVKTLLSSTGAIEDMVLVPSATAYNRIAWTGSVSSIKVRKNERWL